MASENSPPVPGLRERKRRETTKRIRAAGLKLFAEKGYDATTLDDIAAAADISRRTFFYYFKSKEDILLSLREDADEGLGPAMRAVPADRRPIEAAKEALASLCARYRSEELLMADRLMRASETIQAGKQSFYIEREKAMFAALQERWPEPEREAALRVVAMVCVSAFRLALEKFHAEGGRRPLVTTFLEAFETLEGEMRGL